MNKNIKYFSLCIFTSMLLTACGGDPEWMAVYEECKLQMDEQISKMQTNLQEAGDNPQAQAMLNSMNTMAINMAMTACEMIRTTCENDPDGAVCRAYIDHPRQN